MKKTEKGKSQQEDDKISRKKALKKIGLTALSAATMMILLNDPAKAADGSQPEIPPDDF